MKYEHYIEKFYYFKNIDDELLIKIWIGPSEKYIVTELNNKKIKEEKIKILNHEEQLNKLLELGLTVHPLTRNNALEKYSSWGIFASTPEKEEQRFNNIKKIFPKATLIKLNSCMEGDFGVDLYGEL